MIVPKGISIEELKNKTCIVNGVFDLFHVGHLHLLETAKKTFNKVIVAIDADNVVPIYKKPPFIPQEDRLRICSSLKCVDKAIMLDLDKNPFVNKEVDQISFMKELNADYLFCAGDLTYIKRWFNDLYEVDRVIYQERYPYESSTKIKERIKNS